MYKKKKKFWAKHWDIITLDTLASLLALFVALFFRFDMILFVDIMPHEYIFENILIMIVFASILNAALRDPYTGIVHRNKWQELKAVVIHSFVNLAGVLIFLYAFRYSNRVSRIVIFTWFACMVVIMFAFRIIFKRFIRYRKHDDSLKSTMLIIADSNTINHCLSQLAGSEYVEYKVIGCCVVDKDWVGKKIN